MSPILKAAFWMTGAIVSFSVMAVGGRELAGELDTFEIMMYRSAIGMVIVLVVASWVGTLHQVRTQKFGQHALRNLAHFIGQNLWFYAVTLIPLAQVFALEFTTPLWVIILAPLVLGERLTWVRGVVALMGFAGIMIVARPEFSNLNAGLVTAASCAIFFALTILITKRLTQTESITCILFYLTTIQLVFGILAAGYDGDVALPSAAGLPFVILISIGGLLAHFCITNALAIAPATVVVPFDFVRLPVIAIVGMLLYTEALDIWVFVGALLIFAGNYLNIWVETSKNRD